MKKSIKQDLLNFIKDMLSNNDRKFFTKIFLLFNSANYKKIFI